MILGRGDHMLEAERLLYWNGLCRVGRPRTGPSPLSWLWALLCGPFYFAAHGFWGRAALLVVLDLLLVGLILSPFMVYPAWAARAVQEDRQLGLLARARSAGAPLDAAPA